MSAIRQMLLGAASGVAAAPPANTALPVISGTTQVGSTLTTTNGTWSGSPTGYTYQWLRGGSNISGATASTYLLVSADNAATITVTVTASNAGGSASATSSGVGPVSAGFATFDGTATQVTLSNGNLTATHSGTNTDSGARSTATKSTGKYYFEVTVVNTPTGTGDIGILLSTGTYNDFVTNAINSTQVTTDGQIFTNQSTGPALGAFAAGNVACFAIDLTARKAWIRKNGGNWNNNAGFDPASGIGGVTIAAGAFAPAVGFNVSTNGNSLTANFGATAFAQAVPSGFTSGWA